MAHGNRLHFSANFAHNASFLENPQNLRTKLGRSLNVMTPRRFPKLRINSAAIWIAVPSLTHSDQAFGEAARRGGVDRAGSMRVTPLGLKILLPIKFLRRLHLLLPPSQIIHIVVVRPKVIAAGQRALSIHYQASQRWKTALSEPVIQSASPFLAELRAKSLLLQWQQPHVFQNVSVRRVRARIGNTHVTSKSVNESPEQLSAILGY